MPRNPVHVRATSSGPDRPLGGFTCQSYSDGHNVHYIPVLKIAPNLDPTDATITVDEDRILLTVESTTIEVQHHNPRAIATLVAENGSRCQWFPRLRCACWTRSGGRKWISLSLGPLTPCISAEEARAAEEQMRS